MGRSQKKGVVVAEPEFGLMCFEDEEGAKGLGMQGVFLHPRKCKKMVCPLEPLERTQPREHLDISLISLVLDFCFPGL